MAMHNLSGKLVSKLVSAGRQETTSVRLSARVLNALERGELAHYAIIRGMPIQELCRPIRTSAELAKLTHEEVLAYNGLGRKAAREIHSALKAAGYPGLAGGWPDNWRYAPEPE
jgi:DNA-directed RNA polymerase alpha subunit